MGREQNQRQLFGGKSPLHKKILAVPHRQTRGDSRTSPLLLPRTLLLHRQVPPSPFRVPCYLPTMKRPSSRRRPLRSQAALTLMLCLQMQTFCSKQQNIAPQGPRLEAKLVGQRQIPSVLLFHLGEQI